MKTILFQGDSITDAGRNRENDDFLGCGYPTMVAGELGCDHPGDYRFINRAIGGDRSVDVYARIKRDAILLKPDVMSILVGVNDVWHELDSGNGISEERYGQILTMMMEDLKAALPDTKFMIMEPFVLKGSGTQDTWDVFRPEVEKRAEKAKLVAEQFHALFVPLQQALDQASAGMDAGLWLRDGVHPTPAGHELIKRKWLEAFRKL